LLATERKQEFDELHEDLEQDLKPRGARARLSRRGPKGLAPDNQTKAEESCSTTKAGNKNPNASAPPDQASKDQSRTRFTVTAQDLGGNEPGFNSGLALQIVCATVRGKDIDHDDANFALEFVKGAKPQDPIEAALATQMASIHIQVMRFVYHFGNARTGAEFNHYESMLTRLARTFVAQVEALKRYRNTSEPGVTVQKVSVKDGGQAIVGNVTQNPASTVPNKVPASPLSITDAKLAPMPLVSEQEAEPVPARRARRASNG
jgi:hypothetical protein